MLIVIKQNNINDRMQFDMIDHVGLGNLLSATVMLMLPTGVDASLAEACFWALFGGSVVDVLLFADLRT
jgi:hypothetical protein